MFEKFMTKILTKALKASRNLSKANRKLIMDPLKLCSRCVNEFVWQTKEGLLLCEECNKEYCDELKTNMG